MPYAPDHREKTRSRILDAAARLFKRHGYDGVGIDRIMAEAGLTRGGFYAHFPSKDALFAATIRRDGPSLEMGKTVRDKATQDGFAKAFLDVYLSEAHRADVETGCPMVALSTDVSRAGQEAREAYTHMVRHTVEQFSAALPHDGQDGQARAYGVLALAVGAVVISRAVEDGAAALDVLEACRKVADTLT